MPRWTFEPGHTAAEFRVRHMMVTFVRGAFKNVRGRLDFDPMDPGRASVEVTMDSSGIWTGEQTRDAHLRSEDFLDVANHPEITFRSTGVDVVGSHDFVVAGELKIRGVTKPATLKVRYLGQWRTPWWEDGVDKGPKMRAGFTAKTEIDRHDFGVSWNDVLDRGGVVVGDIVYVTIDAEAIQETA